LDDFPVADISFHLTDPASVVWLDLCRPREVLNSLLRRDLHTVGEAMTPPYYQDVYDHVLRATEWTESLRDLIATTVETNLTVQANRMNLIMKKVTSWAATIAVPTAITGFYGQNLPYPGSGAHWGVLTSVGPISVRFGCSPHLQTKRLALIGHQRSRGVRHRPTVGVGSHGCGRDVINVRPERLSPGAVEIGRASAAPTGTGPRDVAGRG
jgi:hypothetical protein